MTMEVSDVLRKAAERIDEGTWCQGSYVQWEFLDNKFTGITDAAEQLRVAYDHELKACAVGQVQLVAAHHIEDYDEATALHMEAVRALWRELGMKIGVESWNDLSGRTASEVSALMRRVADNLIGLEA